MSPDCWLIEPMKKMLGVQKFASDTKIQLVIRQWLERQPASFFTSGIQKVVGKWDKCLNELGRYVEKWNTDVKHLRGNSTLLSLFIFFSRSHAVCHLWSCELR